MGVRLEKVIIDLEDRFTSIALRQAAAAETLEKALDSLGRSGGKANLDRLSESAVRSRKNIAPLPGEIDKVGAAARRAGPEVDKLSGRLRIYGDLLAILGPGVIPIAAVAVPALTGIATAAAGIGTALGGAVVAFVGVGDAVEAVEKARLEPTVANLQAARDAVSQLGPDAAEFVMRFAELRPVLREIRDGAAEGLFGGGLTASLDEFEQLAPRIEAILRETNAATGAAILDGAESLNSPRWSEFLTFLEAELPAAVTSASKIIGDLTHGASEMWMEFDPANDSFLDWLEGVAEGFDNWASSAKGRDDIAGFLAYVRETGPQVEALFVSLVGVLTQVSQAAAPLSGVVLEGLTAILNLVSSVADSDLGTPIMAGVAALALYNRSLAVSASLQKSMAAGGVSVMGGFVGPTKTKISEAVSALTTVTSAQDRARMSSQQLAAAEQKKAAALRAGAGAALKAGGAAAGLAVLSSGIADGFELQNTASLALMGAMVGGVAGAVAGGLVGAYLDVSDASGKAADALDRANQTMEEGQGSIDSRRQAIADLRAEAAAYADDVDNDSIGEFFSNSFDPDFYVNALRNGPLGAGTLNDQMATEAAKLEAEVLRIENAYTKLGQAMGAETIRTNSALVPEFMERTTLAAGDMERVMLRAAPALEALGISQQEFANADPRQLAAFNSEILRWVNEVDSVEGRSRAVGEAISMIGDESVTSAAAAEALGASLDALLNPFLNAEQATDQWRLAVKELRNELEASAGFTGNTNAAIENRRLTAEYVADVQQRLVANAAAGDSELEIAAAARESREMFIEAGIAAGFNRREMVARANAIGLTPKLVRTIFEAAGIDEVTAKARTAVDAYQSLPKNVRTELRAEGIPQTVGQVNALVDKYELTEKQRKALITLMDNASPGIRTVAQLLDAVGRKRPRPRVDAETGAAASKLGAVIGMLGAIKSKTVTITTIVQQQQGKSDRMLGGAGSNAIGGFYDDGVRQFAAGGFGSNGRYYDRNPMIVTGGANILWGEKSTGWEAYISGDPSHRDRNIDILAEAADRLGIGVTAASGLIGSTYSRGRSSDRRLDHMSEALDNVTRDLLGLGEAADLAGKAETKRLEKAEKAAQRENDARQSVVDVLESERDSLEESIRSSLQRDLFGEPTEARSVLPEGWANLDPEAAAAWYAVQQQLMGPGSISSPFDSLAATRAETAERRRLRERLERADVDGDALVQLLTGPIAQVAAFVDSSTDATLRRYERDYERTAVMANQEAAAGGEARFGAAQRAAAKAAARSEERLKDITKTLERNERQQAARDNAAPRQIGAEVTRSFNVPLVRSGRGGGIR